MNKKSNLQEALKKAFEDHREPLHEAQWDRLNASLDEEKSRKKRFLPWLFSILAIAIISVAIGFWFGKNSDTLINKNFENDRLSVNSQTENRDSMNKTKITENTDKNTTNNTPEENNNQNTGSNGVKQTNNDRTNAINNDKNSVNDQANDPGKIKDKQPKGKNNDLTLKDKTNTKKGKTSSADIVQNDSKENKNGDNNSKSNINSKELEIKKELEPEKTNLNEEIKIALKPDKDENKDPEMDGRTNAITNNDTPGIKTDSTGKTKGKPGENDPPKRKKFAIGFATGLSPVNVKVKEMGNPEKLHKDTRSLFDQGNQNSRSVFANFTFDWYVLKNFNLSFNSGLQYRQISQDVNINYIYNEVPFRDTNNAIIGYFTKPNGFADTFTLKRTNTLNFVTLPFRFGYTIPVNKKNEFVLSAGFNVSFLTKAKGSTFTFKEGGMLKPLGEAYKNKANVGLMGGLQFSRNLYRQWWLGLEVQWQQTKYNYNADYGIIKSKINITNYNMCIRYKF